MSETNGALKLYNQTAPMAKTLHFAVGVVGPYFDS
jgi:hypothetical protein